MTAPDESRPPTRVVLAPGAGAGAGSEWMVRWAQVLAVLGPVTTLSWPYQSAGRRRPDPFPVLVETLECVARGPGPLVLVGKSLGSRVAAAAARSVGAALVVGLGYPLVGASGRRRDALLRELEVPLFLAQGTRDRMAPLEELRAVLASRSHPTTLFVVEGGDHSLELGKRELARRGTTQRRLDETVVAAIAEATDQALAAHRAR